MPVNPNGVHGDKWRATVGDGLELGRVARWSSLQHASACEIP
ncbi:hypothetical protein TIFTF001_003931 [Ficus carica]|uniref:Uncharacterized protein n=1 Tax=Ficus carica TaxID=3494 RepID=A0AA88DBP1_FICCA|nr:hypothetical protein TIFTF001_003931 [Ficus carica]